MKKSTIIYGLIAGLFVTTIMDIGMAKLYSTGGEGGAGSMVFGYATMLIAFSLIFVSIKTYRDKTGGFISFGKAFTIGLGISLIASTIYVIGWMVEYYAFFPDFYDKCEVHSIAKLKTTGAPLSQINAKTQEYEQLKQSIKNPVIHALMTYIEILPVGLLVSLIAALILKRKLEGEQPVFANRAG